MLPGDLPTDATTSAARRDGVLGAVGVIVQHVKLGKAGARAGVREGDLVIELNGTQIALLPPIPSFPSLPLCLS